MYRRILAIIFFLFSIDSSAQQPVYATARWFKVEDGLPQSFVSGLQQDQDGFLWVGTRDGLARYDGKEFKIFRQQKQDSLSLSSNVITEIFLDAQNLLWIFYINKKVDCFDPRKMQVCFRDSFSAVRQLLTTLKIKNFSRDQSGTFWFNSNYRFLVSYDPLKNKTTRFDSINKNLTGKYNLGITEDSKGRIYVFTEIGIETLNTTGKGKKIVVPYDPELHFSYNPGATTHAIAMPDGRLVLAETNRLLLFDPGDKKFYSYSLPVKALKDSIKHIKIGNDGLLYLVIGDGVYRFEKDNRFSWLWQAVSSNPFANDAKSFLIDKSGVMWFGTNAAGMVTINLQSLPFSTSPYTINFTTDLLSVITGSSINIPPVFKEGKWAYNLRYCYDRNNTLWLSYNDNEEKENQLSVFTLNNKTFLPVPAPSGKFPLIRGFCLSTSGTMYGMDLRGNIWNWENAHSRPTMIPSVLSLESTSSVVDMEADDNVFWVSTNKEGLYKIEYNKIVKHFSIETLKKYWPGNQLTDLCNDPVDKNILWIGTLGDGLIRLNKKTDQAKIFTIENGLPNNTVYSIVPDKNSNLWISTNTGISRFSPETNSFSNFDVKDGLTGNEFNRFHHLRLPDGHIAFGGPDGFSLFDPANFIRDSFFTSIGLTRLLINNKPVEYSGTGGLLPQPLNQLNRLVLRYDKNFLQFEFAALQFNQPERIRYRYMLKGYDKEWIETGNRSIAIYTKLPPGNYTLLLTASNTSGTWSPLIKNISIRIMPPFWATWWAYCIYFLLLLSLAVVYWKYRTNRIRMQHEIVLEQSKAKQLKEVDEIKNRFFSNITHELRTPLTLILTPIEKLKNENHYSPADQRILSGVYKNTEHLLRLINQLLDVSKIESKQMKVNATIGDMAEFLETCVQQFSLQAKERNIQLQFSNINVTGNYFFDEEKWEKIIFNLLSNAIKFTPEGGTVTTSIELIQLNGMLQLIVTDTGIGIREEEKQKIFDRFYMADDSSTRKQQGTGIGLSLVKELAELMNGQIEVKSSYGKGSTFIVEIPIKIETATTSHETSPVNKIAKPTTTSIELQSKDVKEGPLVLVVEDNEELLSFIVDSLSPAWRILQASNGKLAWDIILKELPDIIISDVMMPEMNGDELCQRIKEDARTGHISVILLTAKAAHESRLEGLKKGADEYLTKPFHLDELELRLQNLVKQQERFRNHLQKELLPESPLKKLPHVNDIFIQNLYKELDELLINPDFSVDLLAQTMALSQRTLNRKLRAILNISPVEFIRKYRLQKAAVLISSGHHISDAAYSVGFDTASYFTQCFKEEYGKTPTDFLNQKVS